MSVLKRNREIAYTEFERQMCNICKELKARLSTLPARYHKYLDRKIYEPASRAFEAVILANEKNAYNDKERQKRDALFYAALADIGKLQKPLLAYWNIKDSKEGGMKQIADMIGREYGLIYGILDRKDVPPMIVTLPKKKMQELLFLGKMSELHKYCYQKIGHAPNDCTDFISARIADFADTALYHVVLANHKQPETRQEAEKRAEHLQGAIDCLNGMQRPMLALWNLIEYSENTMDEWAGLLDEEIRLLEGLKKSDKARYKGLK